MKRINTHSCVASDDEATGRYADEPNSGSSIGGVGNISSVGHYFVVQFLISENRVSPRGFVKFAVKP